MEISIELLRLKTWTIVTYFLFLFLSHSVHSSANALDFQTIIIVIVHFIRRKTIRFMNTLTVDGNPFEGSTSSSGFK